MINDTINDMKKRCEFFLNKKTLVHVSTKSAFYNGYIFEIHEDHIILEDRFFGELPIFFKEISKVMPYKSEENKE